MSFTQKDYKGESLLISDGIIGYRQWRFGPLTSKLYSLNEEEWNSPSLIGTCKNHWSHTVPEERCSCGIYAHYLPLESYSRDHQVLGVVKASGKIILGSKGFRAEKMTILALTGVGYSRDTFGFQGEKRSSQMLVDFCTSHALSYFPGVKDMVHQFPHRDLSNLGVDLVSLETDIKAEAARKKLVADTHRANAQKHLQAYAMQAGTGRIGDSLVSMLQYVKTTYGDRGLQTFKTLGGY